MREGGREFRKNGGMKREGEQEKQERERENKNPIIVDDI